MSGDRLLVIGQGNAPETMRSLGLAQRVAGVGGRVGVILLDAERSAAESLAAYGVDDVWLVEGGAADSRAQAVATLAQDQGARLILAVDSGDLREVLVGAAAAMGSPFAPGCIRFERNAAGGFALGRPCLNGGGYAHMQFDGEGPLVATLVAESFWPAQPARQSADLTVREVSLQAAADRIRVLEEIPADLANLDISSANLVFGAGAGIGSRENFEQLSALATSLGGVCGASRVAVDRGWASREEQIGQTGRTIAPKMYVAWGISGAVQHLAGIRGSEVIVAVNHDPEAPIFRFADVQVVADAPSLAAAMIEKACNGAVSHVEEVAG